MIVGVKANGSHFHFPATDGYINNCPISFPHVDHVVLLVGYTSTHWIIKNSWGTNWGINGTMILDSNYDCGMNSDVVSMDVPTKNTNV